MMSRHSSLRSGLWKCLVRITEKLSESWDQRWRSWRTWSAWWVVGAVVAVSCCRWRRSQLRCFSSSLFLVAKWRWFFHTWKLNEWVAKMMGLGISVFPSKSYGYFLGGGLKYFSCSSLFKEMIQFDEHIFQMGWFNHQLVFGYCDFEDSWSHGTQFISQQIIATAAKAHLKNDSFVRDSPPKSPGNSGFRFCLKELPRHIFAKVFFW